MTTSGDSVDRLCVECWEAEDARCPVDGYARHQVLPRHCDHHPFRMTTDQPSDVRLCAVCGETERYTGAAAMLLRHQHVRPFMGSDHQFTPANEPTPSDVRTDLVRANGTLFSERIWACKVGGVVPMLPSESDEPMRLAVERAFFEITGVEAQFTFSGWGVELTEPERAVVENRLPSEEHYQQWLREHPQARQ